MPSKSKQTRLTPLQREVRANAEAWRRTLEANPGEHPMPRTKAGRAAEALRLLKNGPSFLHEPGRERDLAAYRLWASTWIEPTLRELTPPSRSDKR